jgi:hypothetical protein
MTTKYPFSKTEHGLLIESPLPVSRNLMLLHFKEEVEQNPLAVFSEGFDRETLTRIVSIVDVENFTIQQKFSQIHYWSHHIADIVGPLGFYLIPNYTHHRISIVNEKSAIMVGLIAYNINPYYVAMIDQYFGWGRIELYELIARATHEVITINYLQMNAKDMTLTYQVNNEQRVTLGYNLQATLQKDYFNLQSYYKPQSPMQVPVVQSSVLSA